MSWAFLNDYLDVQKGFSVADATLVLPHALHVPPFVHCQFKCHFTLTISMRSACSLFQPASFRNALGGFPRPSQSLQELLQT